MMRVKVDNFGKVQFGTLCGLLMDQGTDCTTAIVRVDGYGMYLHSFHPSRVSPTTPEEEEAYKP